MHFQVKNFMFQHCLSYQKVGNWFAVISFPKTFQKWGYFPHFLLKLLYPLHFPQKELCSFHCLRFKDSNLVVSHWLDFQWSTNTHFSHQSPSQFGLTNWNRLLSGLAIQTAQAFSVRSQRHHTQLEGSCTLQYHTCLTKLTFPKALPQQRLLSIFKSSPRKAFTKYWHWATGAPEEGQCQESYLWYYFPSHLGFPWRSNIQSLCWAYDWMGITAISVTDLHMLKNRNTFNYQEKLR